MNAGGGNWNDDNCGLMQAYVCEKFLGAQSNTVIPTPIPTGGCPAGKAIKIS